MKENQHYNTTFVQLLCLFAVEWKGGEGCESDEGVLGGSWFNGLMRIRRGGRRLTRSVFRSQEVDK